MMHSSVKIANLIPIWQLPHLEDPHLTIPIAPHSDSYPSNSEADVTRLEWHKAMSQLQTDGEQGIQTIYRVLEMATRQGFYPSIAMSELALGYYEGQRGRSRPARRHLLNALAEVRLNDFPIHEGVNYYYLAWVCCHENARCEALTYLQQSLFLSHHSQSGLLEASTHFQLGHVYRWEKEWERAFNHTQQSLTLFLVLDHPQGILETYHQQVCILEEAQQLEEAERVLKLALAQGQEYGTLEHQIRLIQKYSFLKYKQGDLSSSTYALGILMMQPNLTEDFTLENYELARKLQAALGKKYFEKLAMLYAELPLGTFIQTLLEQ